MTILRMTLRAALLACLLPGPAQAQQIDPPARGGADVQDMYARALQSLSEGRKTDASEMLMQVIENESLHAGAYLEVALIQCSLGRADEAERLFAIVETRFNPPLAILELIAEARERGCDKWQSMASTAVSIGRGLDQNVNQGSSKPSYIVERDGGVFEWQLQSDFLPQHDQYTQLSAEHVRDVTRNGSVGFVQFQGRRNDTLSQYDSASVYAGIETPWRLGRWTARTTAMLGFAALGGHYYQRQAQLQARVMPPLPLPPSMQFSVTGGLTRSEYMTLENFNSTTLELRSQLSYRKGPLYASASFGVLDDRASERRPGGNRHGVAGSLLARRTLGARFNGELAYSYQTWRGSLPYARPLIPLVRDQTNHMLRGTLAYPISKNQSVQLEWREMRNRENISIFQYNNRIFQLSWNVQGL